MRVWALVLFIAGLWMLLVAPGSCIGGLHAGVFARHQAREVREALGPNPPTGVADALERLEDHAAGSVEQAVWAGWHHLIAGALLIAAAVTIARRPRPRAWTPP